MIHCSYPSQCMWFYWQFGSRTQVHLSALSKWQGQGMSKWSCSLRTLGHLSQLSLCQKPLYLLENLLEIKCLIRFTLRHLVKKILIADKCLAIEPEMSVETQGKLNRFLCTMLLHTQFCVWLPSMIYNKDQFSKNAERQANTQMYVVKGTDIFVWLTFVSLCETLDKRKLI